METNDIPPIDTLEITHAEPNTTTLSKATNTLYNDNNNTGSQNLDYSIHAHVIENETSHTKSYINTITIGGNTKEETLENPKKLFNSNDGVVDISWGFYHY